MAEWFVRETQNLLSAIGRRSNLILAEFLLVLALFLFFLIAFSRDAFFVFSLVFTKRSFASVFNFYEAKLCLCV